jgi:hypothetical protein
MPDKSLGKPTKEFLKKVGHPAELFDYIRMARQIAKE